MTNSRYRPTAVVGGQQLIFRYADAQRRFWRVRPSKTSGILHSTRDYVSWRGFAQTAPDDGGTHAPYRVTGVRRMRYRRA